MTCMQQSAARAAEALAAHECSGCTDVTGFGLLGHVAEMAKASQVHIDLDLDRVPVLPGALDCISSGELSSLHRQNAAASSVVSNFEELKSDARWPILVDPQTAGGLLAGVPADMARSCLEALAAAGYDQAAIIGQVSGKQQQGLPVDQFVKVTRFIL